ncbi:uncharacterized protein LOC124631506 [Helicoverpa zea]|uniref:uncharacterized protein LOC124631506 n=1 Tax=Helicoverpa zea TaxID=7113 RepID=UPI001F561E42|nr:uncharacterized protein LOC124631506 [Helicoverpa zea]
MEWSKDRTLKLIELLQVNASLWNPSLCETRRDKQKRREELRLISDILGISVPDVTKKIQHLRTQYNRESAREVRAYVEDPNDRYVSNWYAFEYLHFLKDSSKPYRVLQSEDNSEISGQSSHSDNAVSDCKLASLSPPHKISRTEPAVPAVKPEIVYPTISRPRDEFSVFGEYIANELRSLKGEKNLLVAKKKIQDAIFDVKMGMIGETRTEQGPLCSKLYSTPVMTTAAHIEPLSASQTPSTTGISEIIINGACHYSNFKVDTQ